MRANARTAATDRLTQRMTELIHEIEEEYRQKRLEALWKKWRVYILGAITVIVGGVGAHQYWLYSERQAAEQASSEFMKAATQFGQAGSEKQAAAAFEKLANTSADGYKFAAMMNQAAALAVGGDVNKAVAIYDEIAEKRIGGSAMSDLARYRAALLLADTTAQVDLQNRLEPLVSGTGPWAMLGRELKAYATWRAGNLSDARKQYDLLANDGAAPEGLKVRAKNMLSLLALGVKASGVAPMPAAVPQGPDPTLDLLPESLVAPEIPQ
jgi:hypothetical protein